MILIEDGELSARMGWDSRRMYKVKFTEEKMLGKLAAVFCTGLRR